MKLLSTFTLVVVLTLVKAQTTITRPEAVLEKLGEFKQLVSDYKLYRDGESSLAYFLPLIRRMNPLILRGSFNYTIQAVKKAFAEIGDRNNDVQNVLAAEKQNSCMKNLAVQVDLQTEMNGFFLNDCVNIYDLNVFNVTEDYLTDMEASGVEVDGFPQILINAFIGRNVFTQPEEIVARLQETYVINIANYTETLTRLLDKDNKFALGWNSEAFSIEGCFKEVQSGLANSFTGITSQIPICRKYSGK